MIGNKASSQLVAILVIAVVFVSLLSAVLVLRSQNALTKEKLTNEIVRSTSLDIEIKRVAALRELEGAARTELLIQLKASEDEIETLRNDLADKRKRLSIGAICPRVPEASSSGSGRVEAVTATLDARSERAYLRLRELIAQNEAWVSMCYKTVNAQ